jgi:gliding motility-associated-like protein
LETTFEIYTCDQDQVGTNSINYISAEGCDSVVVFNTLLGEIDILTNIRDVPCGEFNTGQVSISGIYGRLPYLYSFDGSTFGTQNTFSDLSAGTYTLGVQDADGCEAFTEIEIREVSGVEILLPDFVQVDFGDPISLSPVISGEFTEFYWTGIDSLFCETCLVQNYTPLTSTVLTFNVLSVDGCLEKHLVNIAVSKNYEVFIPNAFSPNGDNINDFFTIFADDDVELIQSFRIYSRWGEKVFEGRDFSPNDEQQGWNGQTNGKQMNPGVFIYSATVRFVDGEIRSFEGDFSLIR